MSDTGQQHEPVRGLTFEDVWAMFQENGRETDRRMRETDRRMQETDRRMQETDRRMQETDRELKETGRFIKELTAKTDRQIREMTARTDKQLGKLGNRFGEMVEHLVTPNIVEKFRALGHAFTKAGPEVEFFDRNGKAITEVDIWLENGEFAMAVEVKSHLREQDVDRHGKRMEILRGYLDERGDRRKLLGAMAAAVVNVDVKNYTLEKGFYVIEQSGDTVKIETPDGFRPRAW